jgi:His-Xaa-Ser system radical SAM maturase HxsC
LPLRKKEAFILRGDDAPPGFAAYIAFEDENLERYTETVNVIQISDDLAHLTDGDIIRISPARGRVRVLYRAKAKQNSLLLTERCNHYCLMCSQPPKTNDDSHLIEEVIEVLRLAVDYSTEIGFTGGEPTLLGEELFRLVRIARNLLPDSSLHILSNGRAFEDENNAIKLRDVGHPDLMIGIPIYSDAPEIHNYIVQAENALDGTIRGLNNLNRQGIPVEIRVVLHQINVDRLPQLAEYIATNFPFVSQVAFMGLEMMGFARANKNLLWIEPDEYADKLSKAVMHLDTRHINTLIYNLQMCVMPSDMWPFMVRSISEWKNDYEPECETCAARAMCGGFFSSVIYRKPRNIRALGPSEVESFR